MITAQDLNNPGAIISGMRGYSSICGSDERLPPGSKGGYPELDAATLIYEKMAKEGLFIVSVNKKIKVPGMVLDDVDMGESIDLMVDGADAAVKIAKAIHAEYGVPVGIAKYEGLAAATHMNAQTAITRAEQKGESFHIYDQKEEEDVVDKIMKKFGKH